MTALRKVSPTLLPLLMPLALLTVSACGDIDSLNLGFREAAGDIDEDFLTQLGGGPNGTVDAMIVLSDNSILIGGSFSTVGGFSRNNLFRLSSDGSPDMDFNNRLGSGPNGRVHALLELDDGSILVGGNFTEFNSRSQPYLIKIDRDGRPTTSFNVLGSGFNQAVLALARYDSTSVIVGGDFSEYRGISVGKIARISSDQGGLNSSFRTNSGTGFDLTVNRIRVLSGGRIAVGGSFSSYNGVDRGRLAVLDSDGRINSGFHLSHGGGFNAGVWDILERSGSLIVVGDFNRLSGSIVPYISALRLVDGLPDSTIDSAFGTGFSNATRRLALQANDSMLISGNFSTYRGNIAPGLLRLDDNYDLDSEFMDRIGDGIEAGSINALVVQSDGRILLAGSFTRFNRRSVSNLVRLQ